MFLSRKSRIIILGTLIIAVLVFSFVLFEFYESRQELMKSLGNEAVNLNKSLSLSFENSILTNREVETLISDKLDAIASVVTYPDQKSGDHEEQLDNILSRYQVDYIGIVNRKGHVLTFKTTNDSAVKTLPVELINELEPLFDGDFDWLDFGITDYKLTGTKLYIYARIGNTRNQCILIGINSDRIIDFRRKIGIGRHIQSIADNPDIEYLLLQDNEGIISASKDIKDISSIEADDFLKSVFYSNTTKTRLIDYNGKKVFEAVSSIYLHDSSKVLNRLGLSTIHIRAIQQRSMRRVILIGIGAFLLFSLLYIYLVTRKGFLELKKEHKRFKSYTDIVLDNMSDAIIAVNPSLVIIYFNKAASQIFGVNPDDAIGKHYAAIFENDLLFLNNTLFSNEPVINTDTEYLHPASSKKILEISTSLVYYKNEIDIAIAQVKDLTESKNIQLQLQIKEKLSAMGALASGVAHEIRNPLNAINIIAQRIQREFNPQERKEDFQKFMQTIRSEVTRVNNIVRQFLEFAKPPRLNKTNLVLGDVIDQCIILIEPEAALKNITLLKEVNDEIELFADKEKLKQVFINLFRNSLDAMESGTIKCGITNKNGTAEILISDTGRGIPKEILPRIFNLYFTTKQNGNGLGLSIVHQIISEHSGEIEVDSRENEGTNIIIRLPLRQQHFVPNN